MIQKFREKTPCVAESAYVAQTAVLIGDVTVCEDASIWPGAVLRGDSGKITIGKGSNVQDNATVHCDTGTAVCVGEGVTIGHNAIVHGAKLCDHVMVGMGATVMNNAIVGKNSIIGAGALVPEGMEIPENSIVVGIPAKVMKTTSEKQVENIRHNAEHYVELGREYREMEK